MRSEKTMRVVVAAAEAAADQESEAATPCTGPATRRSLMRMRMVELRSMSVAGFCVLLAAGLCCCLERSLLGCERSSWRDGFPCEWICRSILFRGAGASSAGGRRVAESLEAAAGWIVDAHAITILHVDRNVATRNRTPQRAHKSHESQEAEHIAQHRTRAAITAAIALNNKRHTRKKHT